MLVVAYVLVAAPVIMALYAFVVYPLVLWGLTRVVRARPVGPGRTDWPSVTVTVPVYNAEGSLTATLERLLELDYPREKLQLLVISDGSTDATNSIARGMADRGVELLVLPERKGKTTAENEAVHFARGEIIVNADASVLVRPDALKALVRVFDDPTIGVASGRDRSIGDVENEKTGGESGYTGYEMWLRDLETRLGSIVGASGCFYAIRRAVHSDPLPGDLSWDFASALVARRQGLRSVSVPSAVCIVPRTVALRVEFRRKVRTMARGVRTLFYLREMMNPLKYGRFAVMLVSHKLLRWLPFLFAPISLVTLAILALQRSSAGALLLLPVVFGAAGFVGIRATGRVLPRLFALPGFLVTAAVAGFLAWVEAFRSAPLATWEPTPRPEISQ